MYTFTLLQEQARQRTSAALAEAEVHRMRRATRADRGQADVTELRSLLSDAAVTSLDDLDAWTSLRGRAVNETSRLARAGHLPSHLVVRPHDVPVLISRTLAVAWRRLLRAADGTGAGGRPMRGH